MIYRIVHRTTYKYKYPVSVGNHVACLTPRSLPNHQLARSELRIQPQPATRTEREDYFGNLLCFFTVQEPHKELVVEAHSEVTMNGNAYAWPQRRSHGKRQSSCCPTIKALPGSRPTSLALSHRASGYGRSLRLTHCSHLVPAGRCQKRFWI